MESNRRVDKQRDDFNAGRQKLLKKIHELEILLVGKHEEIAEANKNAALATAKSTIKI